MLHCGQAVEMYVLSWHFSRCAAKAPTAGPIFGHVVCVQRGSTSARRLRRGRVRDCAKGNYEPGPTSANARINLARAPPCCYRGRCGYPRRSSARTEWSLPASARARFSLTKICSHWAVSRAEKSNRVSRLGDRGEIFTARLDHRFIRVISAWIDDHRLRT